MERLRQIWDSYKEIMPAIPLRTSVNVDNSVLDSIMTHTQVNI